jgi:hypothetical protein
MLNWMVRWYQPGGQQSVESFASDYFDLLTRSLLQSSDYLTSTSM